MLSRSVSTFSKNAEDCQHCATQSHCLLGQLQHAEFEQLQPCISKKRFCRGEALSIESEVSATIKIIKIGTVFGYRRGLEGRMRPIDIKGRGSTIGLHGFFGQPNELSIIAASAGRICELPAQALRALAADKPHLYDRLVAELTKSFAHVASWSEGMRVGSVTNQLAYAVLLMTDTQGQSVVDLPSHTALAELLGTTRETIARAFNTLESDGIVRRLERKKCELFHEPLFMRLRAGRPVAPAFA